MRTYSGELCIKFSYTNNLLLKLCGSMWQSIRKMIFLRGEGRVTVLGKGGYMLTLDVNYCVTIQTIGLSIISYSFL